MQIKRIAVSAAIASALAVSEVERRKNPCTACNGRGLVGVPGAPCVFCKGTGINKFPEKIESDLKERK